MAWGERSAGTQALRIGHTAGTSGARANVTLNAAFVRGVSGNAYGVRYRALTNEPINRFYVFLDATTGTRANVTMVARVWNLLAGSTSQPGSTLLATSGVQSLPAADDRWIEFTFPTPYTPAIGEYVFITVENLAAAPTVDFPLILSATAIDSSIVNAVSGPFSTANGFSTAGLGQNEGVHLIVQGTSTVYGNPITANGSLGGFVGKRGILLSDDIKRFKVRWFRSGTASNALTNVQLYDLATPPSGIPLRDHAVPNNADRLAGIADVSAWDLSTLPGSGPFVLCSVWSVTTGAAAVSLIEDYASFPATLNLFSSDNFAHPPVVTESAGNWVVDRSRIGGVYLEAFDTNNIGGGGGGLMLPVGFDGGYSG